MVADNGEAVNRSGAFSKPVPSANPDALNASAWSHRCCADGRRFQPSHPLHAGPRFWEKGAGLHLELTRPIEHRSICVAWQHHADCGDRTLANVIIGYPLGTGCAACRIRAGLIGDRAGGAALLGVHLVRTYAWMCAVGNGGLVNRDADVARRYDAPVSSVHELASHRHGQCLPAVPGAALIRRR